MTGTRKKCPYCGYKQFIPIQVISKNEIITIAEPYIICDMCMEEFEIELQFKVNKKKEKI